MSEPLDERTAMEHVAATTLAYGTPGTVGVELEFVVADAADVSEPLDQGRLLGAVGDLTVPGGRITIEPGGQVELSSHPAPSLTACVTAVVPGLAKLRATLAGAGLRTLDTAMDPGRSPRRLISTPRYDAMEEFFDLDGPAGRLMMCTTASVQVCLDAGTPGDGPTGAQRRWRLAHSLGPVLVAAFANSPVREGRPTGWKSTRWATWLGMDASRTAAPPAVDDVPDAWARYALDARVLGIRGAGRWLVPGDGLTFRDWVRGRGPRHATVADLDFHLSTLFPPVRPRGWLELRMIDGQPGDGWVVPLAVTTALIDDAEAGERALAATARLDPSDRWAGAARHGLGDPTLRTAAEACFAAALDALPGLGAPSSVIEAVCGYLDRYVSRGRCPADDQQEATP